MTAFQIVSLAVLGAVLLWQFVLPKVSTFRLPKQDNVLRHLESVIHIRESSPSPEVKAACNALLQSLLK